MKVNVEEKLEENIDTNLGDDTLPPEVPIEPAGPTAEDNARRLELELAEAKGKLSVLQSVPKPAEVDQFDSISRQAWTDINTMSDTDFEMKHRMEKSKASTLLLQEESKRTNEKHRKEIAELRAEQNLLTKYGSDYSAVKDEVERALADASPEVRQDPVRLAAFMERSFLAISKESTPTPTPRGGPVQRRITNFEKPVARVQPTDAVPKDEIPDEYKKISSAFGIETESERKKLMESDIIEMDMGGGIHYSAASRGFQKKG